MVSTQIEQGLTPSTKAISSVLTSSDCLDRSMVPNSGTLITSMLTSRVGVGWGCGVGSDLGQYAIFWPISARRSTQVCENIRRPNLRSRRQLYRPTFVILVSNEYGRNTARIDVVRLSHIFHEGPILGDIVDFIETQFDVWMPPRHFLQPGLCHGTVRAAVTPEQCDHNRVRFLGVVGGLDRPVRQNCADQCSQNGKDGEANQMERFPSFEGEMGCFRMKITTDPCCCLRHKSGMKAFAQACKHLTTGQGSLQPTKLLILYLYSQFEWEN